MSDDALKTKDREDIAQRYYDMVELAWAKPWVADTDWTDDEEEMQEAVKVGGLQDHAERMYAAINKAKGLVAAMQDKARQHDRLLGQREALARGELRFFKKGMTERAAVTLEIPHDGLDKVTTQALERLNEEIKALDQQIRALLAEV